MEKITVMRSLRIQYGISLKELAVAANVSHQYISSVELGHIYFEGLNNQMQEAFEALIMEKYAQLEKLEKAYGENSNRLLEMEDTV